MLASGAVQVVSFKERIYLAINLKLFYIQYEPLLTLKGYQIIGVDE